MWQTFLQRISGKRGSTDCSYKQIYTSDCVSFCSSEPNDKYVICSPTPLDIMLMFFGSLGSTSVFASSSSSPPTRWQLRTDTNCTATKPAVACTMISTRDVILADESTKLNISTGLVWTFLQMSVWRMWLNVSMLSFFSLRGLAAAALPPPQVFHVNTWKVWEVCSPSRTAFHGSQNTAIPPNVTTRMYIKFLWLKWSWLNCMWCPHQLVGRQITALLVFLWHQRLLLWAGGRANLPNLRYLKSKG